MLNHTQRFLVVLAIVLMAFGQFGCSGTRVVSTWKQEGYSQGPLTRVMIVGIAENDMNRRLFEDSFSAALKERGVAAYTGYSQFPDPKKDPGKEDIKNAAAKLGVNHVLVTHMAGTEKREVYHPPTPRPAPVGYHNTFGNYYTTVFDYVHEPGYYTTHEYVKLESNLYAADTEKLIWTAATETIDPSNTAKVAKELSRTLVGSMKKDGLVQ